MIFGVLLLGLLLVATAVKNTQNELRQQLGNDLFGNQGFIGWIVAFLVIGALGYVPGLHKASRYLLVLLFVVILVQNKGVFANAQMALKEVAAAGPAPEVTTQNAGDPSQGGGTTASGGGGGGGGGGLGGIIGGALKVFGF